MATLLGVQEGAVTADQLPREEALAPCALTLDQTIQRVAAEIGIRGYGEVADVFSADQLERARAQATALVAANGGNYASAEGALGFDGYILHELGKSSVMKQFCRGLYAHTYGGRAQEISFYQILRCLTGRDVRRHSLYFHYDSFAITALVPLVMPVSGQSGDLLLFPNLRRVRRTYLGNVLDKLWLDRTITQRLLKFALHRWLHPVRVKLTPGNIYFFLGYRSLHANEACDERALRATVLFHCIDPHADAPTRKLLARLRGRRGRFETPGAAGAPSPAARNCSETCGRNV